MSSSNRYTLLDIDNTVTTQQPTQPKLAGAWGNKLVIKEEKVPVAAEPVAPTEQRKTDRVFVLPMPKLVQKKAIYPVIWDDLDRVNGVA